MWGYGLQVPQQLHGWHILIADCNSYLIKYEIWIPKWFGQVWNPITVFTGTADYGFMLDWD
jgi:hypothetical protein